MPARHTRAPLHSRPLTPLQLLVHPATWSDAAVLLDAGTQLAPKQSGSAGIYKLASHVYDV